MKKIEKQTLIVLCTIILSLVGILLTVSRINKRQQTQSSAAAATILSFTPSSSFTSPIQKNVGDPLQLDVVADPGTNEVSLTKLEIDYDATKLAPADTNPFVVSTTMPQVVEGPVYQSGKILVVLSIGADPTKAIKTQSTIATFNFKTLAQSSSPTQITFGSMTTVYSLDPASSPSDNVLSSTQPAYITISGTSPTGSVSLTPNPTGTMHPLSWIKDHASLQADDFYIIANGKTFTGNTSSLDLRSESPYPPDFNTTSLDATWYENTIEMRLSLEFKLENGIWRVTEMRTYNGNKPYGDWIYYNGFDGNTLGSLLTQNTADFTSIPNPFNPASTDAGSVHFSNLRLGAFLTQPSATGYSLFRRDSSVQVTTSSTNISYGTGVYLFNNGTFVNDQRSFSYTWTIDNPTLASITPEAFCEVATMPTPCPQDRLSIRGLQTGSTTIHVTVKDSTTQQVIATVPIALTVVNQTVGAGALVKVYLHGIGNSGDNANPIDSTYSNKTPTHQTQYIRLEAYDQAGTLIGSGADYIQYNPIGGYYSGLIDLGFTLSSGNYIIKASLTPKYLKKQILGTPLLTVGQYNQIPDITLTAGDSNGDNRISILDYNILRSCFGSTPAATCTFSLSQDSDLNDDGKIDLSDLNLFLREISVQNGD